jgi:hypothetical protein
VFSSASAETRNAKRSFCDLRRKYSHGPHNVSQDFDLVSRLTIRRGFRGCLRSTRSTFCDMLSLTRIGHHKTRQSGFAFSLTNVAVRHIYEEGLLDF